jgi:hypothetical protein
MELGGGVQGGKRGRGLLGVEDSRNPEVEKKSNRKKLVVCPGFSLYFFPSSMNSLIVRLASATIDFNVFRLTIFPLWIGTFVLFPSLCLKKIA